MAHPFLIIDGYNLLHAAGMARRNYGPGDLEKTRNHLLNYLATRLNQRERATIVFDAADAPYDAPRQSKYEGMTILFAPRGGDADTLIEQLIAAHSAPRQILLISSDHRLQKAARKRRAASLDSELFFLELEQREPHSAQTEQTQRADDPKFTGQVSETETEAMMKIFGEAEDVKAEEKMKESDWQNYLDEFPDDLDELLDDGSPRKT